MKFLIVSSMLCVSTFAADRTTGGSNHAKTEAKRTTSEPSENIITHVYMGGTDARGFRKVYVVAQTPLKDPVLKVNGKTCSLRQVKWEAGADMSGFPYQCVDVSFGPKDKITATVVAWDESNGRRYKTETSGPNEKGNLSLDSWSSTARKDIDFQKEYLEALPRNLQDFARIYRGERPHMKFDKTLAEFAQKRAVYCMTVQGGHAPDVNGQLRSMGYGLSPDISDQGNQFESLWGAGENDPRGALNGWKGHGPHAQHVMGTTAPWSGHTRFGIGFYGGQWVFISAPEPVNVPIGTASRK